MYLHMENMIRTTRFQQNLVKSTLVRKVTNMKIALINENSQAAKNELICNALKKVVEPMGHEVFNYGMLGAEDPNSLTYVQNGILAATLLNSGAADFVITGCGTGEGAMLACNSFPKVLCGHIQSPLDAYLFSQVNDGNCVALPFAENFGWGGELKLEYIFEKLFCAPGGGGYPPERVVQQEDFGQGQRGYPCRYGDHLKEPGS